MCGIAGMIGFNGHNASPDLLKKMSDALTHRGPDASGLHLDREAGLAHRRLSILDLEGGGQPMSNSDGSLWITYNGEIFNYLELREELIAKGHSFATRSDTEVILHLYQAEGERCVHRLNGQWAFAIWDSRQRKLFASRDRMGIQPLFYTIADQTFLFASEIKALFAHPAVARELDLKALDQIFTFWVTLPPRTAFRDVKQLPAGHNLTVQDGQVHVTEYWSLDFSQIEPSDAWDEALVQAKSEELLALLCDATRIRLRADIPVAAYLSGGIDSGVIAALAKRFAPDTLRTFSIAFEDAHLDESLHQQIVSEHLGTAHSQIRCSTRDIGEIFPEVVFHTEQPVLRTAPAPLFLLSKLVRDRGNKVVLTGEGADEILGGYDIFKEAKIRRFWSRQPQSRTRASLLQRLYPYMENIQKQPAAYLASFFRVEGRDGASPFFSHLPRWQLTAKLKSLYSKEVIDYIGTYDAYDELEQSLPAAYAQWPGFCQAQYLETKYLLPGYLLSSQADRMAMSHSVEARYPFLDHRVVEFCQKLHPSLKMRVLDEKFLLKRVARNLLPESILQRPKQPYRAPDGASFATPTSPGYVADVLATQSILRDGIFDPSPVQRLAEKFRSGRAVSVKDNMAMVGVVSTGLLMQQLVVQHQPATYAIH
ncbi:MAG: asparagine synthase (glutamine-hydrolyzing) [Terriglobales bacterium]